MFKTFIKDEFHISTLRMFAFLSGMKKELYSEILSLHLDVRERPSNRNPENALLNYTTYEEVNKKLSSLIKTDAINRANKKLYFLYSTFILISYFGLGIFFTIPFITFLVVSNYKHILTNNYYTLYLKKNISEVEKSIENIILGQNRKRS